jgi:hypothetical protein
MKARPPGPGRRKPSKLASDVSASGGTDSAFVRVEKFAAETLIPDCQDDPDELRKAVAAAIDFYLLGEQIDGIGWRYPHFLRSPAAPASGPPAVEIARDRWDRLSAEAIRQEVSPVELLQFAVVYYCALRNGSPAP